MHFHYISALFCFNCYHYINHCFIHLMYIFCMMNVVRMWKGNIVLRNISGVTEGSTVGAIHCVKSVQVRSFFLVRIFLHSGWIRRFTPVHSFHAVIAFPSKEKFPFLKRHKNEIIHLVLPHFNFWPAIEKYYYESIWTGCRNNSQRIIKR